MMWNRVALIQFANCFNLNTCGVIYVRNHETILLQEGLNGNLCKYEDTTDLFKLENGRSTPGCLTAQSAIRLSLLSRLIAH